jgi:hypothetical protein
MNIPFETALGYKDFREAADTGLLLWRKNFISFMPFFAIPFWICAFALRLIPGLASYWPWLIIWLLKPLFDRPVLHIISVRFFEKDASLKRLCQGLGKSLLRGLPGDLLWRRFSPLRSAMMPVRVLEQNPKSRKKFAQRKELLKKGGIDYCFLLTIWGVAVETALFSGVMLFLVTISELIMEGFAFSMWQSFQNSEIYVYAIYCFSYMLVEPVYVCMGFSLYINSRIEVEGWDIEIIFRDFAKRLKDKSKNISLVALLLLFFFLPLKTFADDGMDADESYVGGSPVGEKSFAASDDVPLEELQEIFNSSDFGGEKNTWGVRLKKPLNARDSSGFNFDRGKMERLRGAIAFALRFILAAAIAALVVALFFYMRKFMRDRDGGDDRPYLKHLHKTREENPELLLEKALGFYKQGDTRLAWGYCTAAAILSWPFYRGLDFPPNATESDCASIVSSTASGGKPNNSLCTIEEAQVFGDLIKNWVYLAYAQRLPPEGSFEQAASFCKLLRAENG